MTTYNTGNPIGSTDSRDRLDNTENMDYLENSTTELTHPDRLGTVRKTRHGMEAEHDAQISAHEVEHDAQIAAHEVEHDNQMQSFETDFYGRLAGMAFTRVGSFTTGATLTDMRQVLVWEAAQGGDGYEYGWTGTFPKVVAAGATPATSGGVGAGAWVDRTDVTLRGYVQDTTIITFKNDSYGSAVDNMIAGRVNGIAGTVVHRAGNIYSTGVGVWECLIDGASAIGNFNAKGPVSICDFGAAGDGTTDDTDAIQLTLNNAGDIYVPAGDFRVSRPLILKSHTSLHGEGKRSRIFCIDGTTVVGIGQTLISGTNVAFVTIAHVNLDNSGIVSFLSGVRAIHFVGSSHYSVSDCLIYTCGAAVASINCNTYSVRDNKIEISSTDGKAYHDGIIDQWGGSSIFTITNNTINGAGIGKYGILVTGTDSNNLGTNSVSFTISGNIVRGVRWTGIWVNGRSGTIKDFSITENVVTSVTEYHGIRLSDVSNGAITSNSVYFANAQGIRLDSEPNYGGSTGVQYVVVSSNSIRECNAGNLTGSEGSAIACFSADYCAFQSNIIAGGNHTHGIYLDVAACTGNSAFNNSVVGGAAQSKPINSSGNSLTSFHVGSGVPTYYSGQGSVHINNTATSKKEAMYILYNGQWRTLDFIVAP